MRILALDVATKTGWAYYDGIGISSGVTNSIKKKSEGEGVPFVKFRQFLDVEFRNIMKFFTTSRKKSEKFQEIFPTSRKKSVRE